MPFRALSIHMPKRFLISAPVLAVAAIVPAPAQVRPAATLEPLRFFEGRTEGEGRVKVVFKPEYGVHVKGRGRIEPDGTLVLVQDVLEEGKPPRQRSWRIRETAPGHYAGSLSDATGPVSLELAPDGRIHIRFRMKGSIAVEQWLTAAADGRTVQNMMIIRKFGLKVATLQETIRKLG